jgi:hypothetical protein
VHYNVAIIAAGVVTWAFGEWIQHPYQMFRKDGYIGDKYQRRAGVLRTTLNVIGGGLVMLGLCRIWKFGVPIL